MVGHKSRAKLRWNSVLKAGEFRRSEIQSRIASKALKAGACYLSVISIAQRSKLMMHDYMRSRAPIT